MELKKGYKQTEVGVIPEEWEVFDLSQVLNRIADVDHYMPKTEKYGIPYVMTGDLQELVEDIDFESCKKISITAYKKLSKKIKNVKGDIILARYATVGTVSFVNIDIDFIVSYSCVTIKPDTSKLVGLFLYYYFKSNVFKLEVKNKVNANIQDNVGIGDLVKMKIAIPPTLPEQKAIAQVLSDSDDLIKALEQKLAKKRAIKQGAMQELLTPKEDWEIKTLFELADYKKQLFDDGDWIEAEHITTNGIRLIQTGNIGLGKYVEKTNKKYINANSFKTLKCKELEEGDLLICRLAEPAGRACILPKLSYDKIITSVDVTIFRPRPDIANRVFLMNLFSTPNWFKIVYESVGGTTHKRISRGSLGKISIKIPSIQEQTKIATILSDMDKEIEQLEQKLSKYKQVKQGLMQQLLTGKIRLV